MEEMMNLEVEKLSEAVEEMKVVKIIFVNGYQMNCTVTDFSDQVLIVHEGGKEKMIYRHAVSTIEL